MAVMEFLDQNLLNTTTMVTTTAASGSGTALYAFDRNTSLGWTSVNYNSTTATVFSIVFAQPVVISHLLLQSHNLRAFSAYYNSLTANSLFTAETTNSATSSYYSFNSVTVSSVDLQMDNTIAGSVEKTFGEIILSNRRLVFAKNPSVGNWKPTIFRKQIVHDMPDGGAKVYNIRDKFRANLEFDFITQSFHDSLKTVHSTAVPLYFLPFPTTTAWDGSAYETVWIGDFNFKHGDNSKTQGYNGSINLRQTSGG